MDNVAHTLLGATLAKAGLGRKTACSLPALMIAANLPDIDIFVAGNQGYFDHHRGITHSFVGVLGLSLALTGAFWIAGRMGFIAGRKQIRFLALWFISAIGILSHLLLDVLGDYGLRPLLPFSPKWYYGDLLSIVDPWVWLVFGCSLFLATETKSGKTAWIAFACVLNTVIFFAAGRIFALCWAIMALVITGGMKALHRRAVNPSRAAFVLFFAYLGLAATVHHAILLMARQTGPLLVSDAISKVSVLPGRPGTAGKWTVILEGSDSYYVTDTGLKNWSLHPLKFERYPKNLRDECYLEALKQPQMAALARFARFPCVEVKVSGGLCQVLFRDLRYARSGTSSWAAETAIVPCNCRRKYTAIDHP